MLRIIKTLFFILMQGGKSAYHIANQRNSFLLPQVGHTVNSKYSTPISVDINTLWRSIFHA